MTVNLPIIGYALADGTGKLAMTPEGIKNKNNLRAVSAAMSWIDSQARELISASGAEHSNRTSPFDYFEGHRVTFEPVCYAKYKLEQILDFYAGQKICLIIPSREVLLKAYDDVVRRIWDRHKYGYNVEVLSVECVDYPLNNIVGIPNKGIHGYLVQNAMRTEIFIENSMKGSLGQRKKPLWA